MQTTWKPGNDRTGFFSTEPNRTEFEKLFYRTEPNRTEPNFGNRTEPNHTKLFLYKCFSKKSWRAPIKVLRIILWNFVKKCLKKFQSQFCEKIFKVNFIVNFLCQFLRTNRVSNRQCYTGMVLLISRIKRTMNRVSLNFLIRFDGGSRISTIHLGPTNYQHHSRLALSIRNTIRIP